MDNFKWCEIEEGTGFRFVFLNGAIIAVHGTFCTGCDATTGRCGELTRMHTTAK